MSDDAVTRFPVEKVRRLPDSMPARRATVESDLDPGNPFTDSLRGLLQERAHLIKRHGRSDAAVAQIEGMIADRLEVLSAREEQTS